MDINTTSVNPTSPGVTFSFTPATNATGTPFLDSEFRYTLFSVVYSIIFILGIFANCYVLFVLRRLSEARGIDEIRIYMANLTIADLLFVSILPFWIGYYCRHGDWTYSDFLCRVSGSMFFINTYCSILFLGAISVNRYWAVTCPLNAASSNHWRRGVAVSCTIWAVNLGLVVPNMLSSNMHTDERNFTRCFEGYHEQTDKKKQRVAAIHFVIIGVFFLVFFLVVVCNLLIAQTLLKKSPAQSRSGTMVSTTKGHKARPVGVKRRAIQMLCAVVGVFVLCFLPHHVVQGPWVLAVLEIREGWGSMGWSLDTRQALNDAHQITLLLMALNCILDPVVYCFATRKFRRFIAGHMKKVTKGDTCGYTVSTQVSMESRNHLAGSAREEGQPNRT